MNTFLLTLVWALILLISVLVVALIICEKTTDDIFEHPTTWKIYWLLIIPVFITGLTLDIASAKAEYTHSHTATEYIVALNDNPGLKSRYYVRRGYVESQMYYNYMVKLSGNSYIANQVPVRKSTIYETDGNYRIEWWTKEKGYLFAKTSENYWKVYIPKNSILSEYDIDLQ